MRRQAVLEAGSRIEGAPHPSTKGSHSGGGAGFPLQSPSPVLTQNRDLIPFSLAREDTVPSLGIDPLDPTPGPYSTSYYVGHFPHKPMVHFKCPHKAFSHVMAPAPVCPQHTPALDLPPFV